MSAGVCSERYTQGDRNIPQDPRFEHLTTSIDTTNQRSWRSPTPPPDPSCPYPLSQCPSPKSHLSSSPSQCPPPETTLLTSPSPCQAPDSLKSNTPDEDLHNANKELLAVTASGETAGTLNHNALVPGFAWCLCSSCRDCTTTHSVTNHVMYINFSQN